MSKVASLESTVRNLEGLNKEMKDNEKRIRDDFDR